MTKIMRKVVQIDEDKCDGCGLCVPSCHEGAIQIIEGKAKLVADNLCDGLGDCLQECPLGAITIIERQADDFDQEAVAKRLTELGRPPVSTSSAEFQGCPGSRAVVFDRSPAIAQPDTGNIESELAQWPVQLHLVPVSAPYFKEADLLVAADCVPLAYAEFHRKLLRGRAVALACPKLDDTDIYARKLAEIIAVNEISSVTVAHMEVPCCSGLVHIVNQAIELSGREVELKDITVTIDGKASSTL